MSLFGERVNEDICTLALLLVHVGAEAHDFEAINSGSELGFF